jgi:hypothetical protein
MVAFLTWEALKEMQINQQLAEVDDSKYLHDKASLIFQVRLNKNQVTCLQHQSLSLQIMDYSLVVGTVQQLALDQKHLKNNL